MFCPECNCEFIGWNAGCPSCTRTPDEVQRSAIPEARLPYTDLVDRLSDAGGALSIELTTTDSGKERKLGFPWRGYGYSWTSRMEGDLSGLPVLLEVTQVGRDRALAFFPYVGYGFAWAVRMEGSIAGNTVRLAAREVRREKKLRFPWRGYGYAWTQRMSGDCGERIRIELEASEVGRADEWTFPYQAYGFGWIRKAVLTMTLDHVDSTV